MANENRVNADRRFSEELTVATTALAVTPSAATIAKNRWKKMTVTAGAAGPFRWRCDGTNPTTTVGHLHSSSNDPLVIEGADRIAKFRCIRDGSTSTTAQVTITG